MPSRKNLEQASDDPTIYPPLILGAARTNLYHDHAKCKHIRFPCEYCIGSLENFWRSPRHGVFTGLCCQVHSASDRSELEIRQTSMTTAIDENIGLAMGYQ